MISTEQITNYVTNALGIFAFIIVGLIGIVLLIAGVNSWRKRKQFHWVVRIKKEDSTGSNNLIEIDRDMGGIFLDKKTQNRLFILKKYKVGLSPDNIPDYQGVGKERIVEVLQLSLKTFRYLQKPVMAINSPATLSYGVQDYDVAWATNEVDRLKLYEKKSFFDKIKDILPIIVVFMLSIIVIYFFMQKFSVLADIAHSLQAASDNMVKVYQSMAQQQTVTMVGK